MSAVIECVPLAVSVMSPYRKERPQRRAVSQKLHANRAGDCGGGGDRIGDIGNRGSRRRGGDADRVHCAGGGDGNHRRSSWHRIIRRDRGQRIRPSDRQRPRDRVRRSGISAEATPLARNCTLVIVPSASTQCRKSRPCRHRRWRLGRRADAGRRRLVSATVTLRPSWWPVARRVGSRGGEGERADGRRRERHKYTGSGVGRARRTPFAKNRTLASYSGGRGRGHRDARGNRERGSAGRKCRQWSLPPVTVR